MVSLHSHSGVPRSPASQVDICDIASLEEAVIDQILELIHAINLTPAQRKDLLRRAALRLEQEEGTLH